MLASSKKPDFSAKPGFLNTNASQTAISHLKLSDRLGANLSSFAINSVLLSDRLGTMIASLYSIKHAQRYLTSLGRLRKREQGRGENFISALFLLPSSLFLLPSSLFLLPSSFFLLPSSFFLLPSQTMSKIIEILSPEEVRRTLTRMASQIVEKSGDPSELVLLGIRTRGVPLAQILAAQIEVLEQMKVATGALDITFYRDDLDRVAMRTPAKTEIPFDLTGKTVVLVDDVIYKGRTTRAALNAVNEYGRPEKIWLAVLVDRGHREVPIHPDFTGKKLPTAKEEQVRVYVQELDDRDGVELIRC
jgi:pyrimidine operon attenuation protein / uracil phosphoribosyltransferase